METSAQNSNLIKNKKHNLYVVFSKTPYKLGAFIRRVTKSDYNHVSISKDLGLSEMYSFSRRYRDAPFYGGFVKESLSRYVYQGKHSMVKVYKISLSESQYKRALNYLNNIKRDGKKYRYNTISACFYPFKIRVRIPYALTCVEFVVDLLSESGVLDTKNLESYCSTKRLMSLISEKCVYSGDALKLFDGKILKNDCFGDKIGILNAVGLTLKSHAKLISDLFFSSANH